MKEYQIIVHPDAGVPQKAVVMVGPMMEGGITDGGNVVGSLFVAIVPNLYHIHIGVGENKNDAVDRALGQIFPNGGEWWFLQVC